MGSLSCGVGSRLGRDLVLLSEVRICDLSFSVFLGGRFGVVLFFRLVSV